MADTKQAKVAKSAVNYRTAADTAKRRCEDCAMFRRKTHSCDLVRGVIFAQYVCDKWTAK